MRASGIGDFRTYFEEHPEDVAECAALVKITDVNQATLDMYAAASLDDLRSGLGLVFAEETYGVFLEELAVLAEGKTTLESEATMQTLTGEKLIVFLKLAVVSGHEDTLSRVMVSITDITERKQAEEALRNSEAKLKTVFEVLPVGISILDAEGETVYANPALARILDIPRKGLLAGDYTARSYLRPDGTAMPAEEFASARAVAEGRAVRDVETGVVKEDGDVAWVSVSAALVAFPDWKVVLVTADITDRKKAEAERVAAQRRYQELFDNVGAGLFRTTPGPKGTFLAVNSAMVAMLEADSREQLLALHPSEIYLDESQLRIVSEAIVRKDFIDEEVRFKTLKGRPIWCHITSRKSIDASGQVCFDNTIEDITERKEAEDRLAAAASEWRETFDAMSDSVALLDEDGKVLRCNTATVRLVGRDFEQIIGRPCHEVFPKSETWCVGCPQLEARRSLKTETMLIQQDGRWQQVTFQPRTDAQGEFAGVIHIVSDVTALKQTEQELQSTVQHLQSIVEQVIVAIGGIVEARDPYTAGHEQRVSRLAMAIARRMGLDEGVVAGVRVAGLVHDVGKTTVPTEILTKPGLLSAVEFELIKAHSQASHDVLQGIEFRWPVAQAALQHHERLDGSGYPQGLDAGQIILEARILAVADVVEAMSSHRPYREALGVDAALEEIKKKRGTLFDPNAVDACVALFRKNGFSFD